MLPCEVLAKKVFPAIRGVLAVMLVKDYGLSVYEASKILGITPAAVSNYLSRKRGEALFNMIINDDEIYRRLKKLASRLAQGEAKVEEYMSFMCDLCIDIRRGKVLKGLGEYVPLRAPTYRCQTKRCNERKPR